MQVRIPGILFEAAYLALALPILVPDPQSSQRRSQRTIQGSGLMTIPFCWETEFT